jgi:cation transport protein ChaC
MDEFWVFGYGSLMWNPGFAYEQRLEARANGYRRSLCVRSFVHRGTPENPGLVLGLDRGGSCRGMAFRIATPAWDDVVAYLRERELVTNVYFERRLPVTLRDGRRVQALTYVVDRRHAQYAGAVDVEAAAAIVSRSTGQSGPNHLYVANTLAHMQEMGIRDRWLEQVAALVLDGT